MLMMIDRPSYARSVSSFARVRGAARATLGLVDMALLWPLRALENRRLLDDMGAMNDHELRDVGLTRQDLRDATALPAGRDPGRLFAARAASRRSLSAGRAG